MLANMIKRSARNLRPNRPEIVSLPFPVYRGKGDSRRCRMLRQALSRERRWEIITAYLQTLEDMVAPIAVESDLPFPKRLIRIAIFQELFENPDTEMRNHLEIAYVQLEAFIPYEEFRVLADFKAASLKAQEMADTGDPTSIIQSVKIMRKAMGDRAVSIQEMISDKMRIRLTQIREIGSGAGSAGYDFQDSWQH